MKKYILILIILLSPLISYTDECIVNGVDRCSSDNATRLSTNTGSQSSSAGVKITSPFVEEVDGLIPLLKIIIQGVTMIAIPILVLGFIYAGFRFVTAQGDTNQLGTARRIFMYTVIAALIILGSNVILTLVEDTASAILN